MSDQAKVTLISNAKTFIVSFIVAVGAVVAQGNIEWTTVFWIAALTTGIRAGVTAILNLYLPVRLGGKK